MKKNKKFLLTTTILLSTCMLSACSLDSLFKKTPTAEELLTRSWNIEDTTYIDADMELDMSASMDMSEYSDEADVKMNMEIALDMNMIGSKDTQYVNGDIYVSALGMEIETPCEAYSITKDDIITTYSYDVESDQWFVEEADADDVDSSVIDLSKLKNGIDIEIFESYEMKDVEKEDTVYTVNGIVSIEKLLDNVGEQGEELLENTLQSEDFDFSELTLNTTILFDRETQDLLSIEINIDPESIDMKDSGIELDEARIYIKINEKNDTDTLEIPKNIVKNAVESNEFDGSTGLDIDYPDEEPIVIETEPQIYVDVEQPKTTTLGTIDNFTNYRFSINNNTLILPISYADLNAATGWEFKSSEAKSYMSGEDYMFTDLYNANGDLVCYITLLNETNDDALYTDCKIVSISQSKYDIENGDYVINFPCGLQVGDKATFEDLLVIFGEPTEVYEDTEDPDWAYATYTWSEDTTWTSDNRISITIINGVIDDITLDHSNY